MRGRAATVRRRDTVTVVTFTFTVDVIGSARASAGPAAGARIRGAKSPSERSY